MIATPRRQFLQSLGGSALVATAYRMSAGWLCAQGTDPHTVKASLLDGPPFASLPASFDDDVTLPAGFRYEVLLRRGDRLNDRGDAYGDDNDFFALLPRSHSEGWLWVNHESTDAFLLLEAAVTESRLNRDLFSRYLQSMGGSCLRMTRNTAGRWRPVLPDPRNFRLDGHTPGIVFTGPGAGSEWLGGARTSVGSVANCGGGVTPWGTILTAEENVYAVFGDREMGDPPTIVNRHFDRPTEHYGYLVEVDPETRSFWKHTALGRFAHENIVFAIAKDGRLVGYMGDDRPRQCIYKYVSTAAFDPKGGASNRRLLEEGTLHVANTIAGRWIPLDPARQSTLRNARFDRARVCVHTRTAALLCGGTPHGRPEGISRHPVHGDVFVSLSAHESQSRTPDKPSDLAGAIARIREAGNDPGAMEFTFDIFLMSGTDTGLAWPDNVSFVNDTSLMVCTDYKSHHPAMPRTTHAKFGNNHLVVVSTSGPDAGRVKRFANGPVDAEFCCPTLTPEGDELWVGVQHPGEGSTHPDTLSSHWPGGGKSWPRSSLIAISSA